jgi:hypothetical protein
MLASAGRHALWVGRCVWRMPAVALPKAAPHQAVPADRFAREIGRFRIIEASVPGGGKVGVVCCGTNRVLTW